jgi:hypothetical protein
MCFSVFLACFVFVVVFGLELQFFVQNKQTNIHTTIAYTHKHNRWGLMSTVCVAVGGVLAIWLPPIFVRKKTKHSQTNKQNTNTNTHTHTQHSLFGL